MSDYITYGLDSDLCRKIELTYGFRHQKIFLSNIRYGFVWLNEAIAVVPSSAHRCYILNDKRQKEILWSGLGCLFYYFSDNSLTVRVTEYVRFSYNDYRIIHIDWLFDLNEMDIILHIKHSTRQYHR